MTFRLKDNKGQVLTEKAAKGTIWFSDSDQKAYLLTCVMNSSTAKEEWHFIDLSNNIGYGNPGWRDFSQLEAHLESFNETMHCIGHVRDLDIESFVAEQQC